MNIVCDRVTRVVALMLLLVSVGGGTGCAMPIRRPPAELSNKPYLFHIPGVSGETFIDREFVRALVKGGFPADSEQCDWTDGRFVLDALQDVPRSREEAKKIASRITARAKMEPDRPIYLTCISGGGGLGVFVLEALPADVKVDGVLLISPAISPTYDLSNALSHVKNKLYVFVSERDRLILGWGTQQFGNIDGGHAQAAGKVGFVRPAGAGAYDKLVEVPYDPEWFWRYGHDGEHAAGEGVRFASGYLAPILTDMAVASQPPAPEKPPRGGPS